MSATQKYSVELGKTRCQFGLDLIQDRAPHPPPASRPCYSDCLVNHLCSGTDRGGKKDREGDREGRVRYQVGSLFIITALFSALMFCNFYKGLFHLFSRHLLASYNMKWKRQQLASNAYLPTSFHLMSVHRT